MFRDKYKTFNSILGLKIPSGFKLYSTFDQSQYFPSLKYLKYSSYSSRKEGVGIVHHVAQSIVPITHVCTFEQFIDGFVGMLTGDYYEFDSLTYDIISLYSGICPPRYTIHYVSRIYGKSHNLLLNNEFLSNYFYAEYIAGFDFSQQRMENLLIFSKKDNINLDRYMDTQILT